ncbi:MAG: hypothetical protein V4473_01275 [Patescibacteria group bacterium]
MIFLGTVIVTRIFLFLKPIPAPTIKGFRIHHWMYGVVGILITLLIHSLILYAVGLGLFVDELTYILIGGKSHKDNYSKISLFGTVIFVIIVFVARDYLILYL